MTDNETYEPDKGGGHLGELRALLAAGDEHGTSALLLSVAGKRAAVDVPQQVRRILTQIVEALDDGLAVSVTPHRRTVTTQEAADILGVSRPTLVRLLDDGRIPHERVGTRRRMALRDVLAYRERRRSAQLAAIDATSVPMDEEDIEESLSVLREVRARQSARRRGRQGGTVGG